MNTSIVEPPHGASLAVPGPADTIPSAPAYVHGRILARDLVWSAYAKLLHPTDSEGVSVWAYQEEVAPEDYRTRQAGAKGAEVVDVVRTHKPRFVTLNAFRETVLAWARKKKLTYATAPCKAEWNLACLANVWVELDYYNKPRWQNLKPEQMLRAFLERVEERRLPYPSFVVFSGKGLYAIWQHDRIAAYGKYGALDIWKAVMKALNDHFVDMGRDTAAMSSTTHLRLAGSKNDGKTVRVAWPEYADQIERHAFSRLKAEILPFTAEQVKAYRAEKAAKKVARKAERETRQAADIAAGKPPKKRTFKLTRRTFQTAVMRDLELLFEDRHQGHPVQQGERDLWLYTMTTAAAWLLAPDALRTEVKRLAPLCGLPVRRALSLMGSVLRNADLAAAGKTRSYKKRSGRDYRYRTNPRKIQDLFNVTVEEAIRLDLRVIVPSALKATRAAERAEAYRRSRGMRDRKAQQAARLEFGRYCLERHAAGVLVDELVFEAKAAFDGKGSRSWVEKAMREARAVTIGKPQVKVKAGRPRKGVTEATAEARNNPCGSSRSITGLDKSDAAVVAGDCPTYDVDVHSVHLTMPDTTPAAVHDPAGVDVSEEVLALQGFRRDRDGFWLEWHDPSEEWQVVDIGYVEWEMYLRAGWEMTPAAVEWSNRTPDFLQPFMPQPEDAIAP